MSVYKMSEIVGTGDSIEEAVRQAVSRATRTLRNVGWFEVQEIRGTVREGEVGEFQVKLSLGFRLDE